MPLAYGKGIVCGRTKRTISEPRAERFAKAARKRNRRASARAFFFADAPDASCASESSDADELTALYFARDERALTATKERYGSFLYTVSMNVVHSVRDAEECVNDCYLACWNTVPPVKPRSFKAYLGSLCRNISLDRYKRAHAQKRGCGMTETLLSEVEEFIPDSSATEAFGAEGEGCGENGPLTAAIGEFLSSLKKEQRVIFVRRYWFCDELWEIARRTGCSEGKVKSVLFRLRKKLKEKLEKEGVNV